jgi:hypothetical protein
MRVTVIVLHVTVTVLEMVTCWMDCAKWLTMLCSAPKESQQVRTDKRPLLTCVV